MYGAKNYHSKNGAKKIKTKENLESCLQLQCYLNIMWRKKVIACTAVFTTLPRQNWKGLISLHSFIYQSKYHLWLIFWKTFKAFRYNTWHCCSNWQNYLAFIRAGVSSVVLVVDQSAVDGFWMSHMEMSPVSSELSSLTRWVGNLLFWPLPCTPRSHCSGCFLSPSPCLSHLKMRIPGKSHLE